MYSLAKNGVVNAREVSAVSSLATRGIITEEGVIKLRSRAFKHYVALKSHDSLLEWRTAGRHNLWRLIWPPAAVLAVLALVFFVNANPEVIAIMLALGGALLGIAPAISSLIKPGVAADGDE